MTAQLDSETARGKKYIALQHHISNAVCAHWGCINRADPADMTAPYDALFYRDEVMIGVAEIKARNLSKHLLEDWGSYILTESKLDANIKLARSYEVPFTLIVYLRHSDTLVFWKITDADGQLLCRYTTKWTQTPETVNGGLIWRENAYIRLDNMKVLPISLTERG